MSDLNEQLKTWPAEIWLQHGDEETPEFSAAHASGEITWCLDNITAGDVRYVRADLAPAAAPAPVAAPIAQPEHSGLMDEIACLNRRIAVMQNELNMRHAKDTGDVWYWQGDGSDDPASMCNVLTVVINAADLRAALAAVPAAAPIVQPVADVDLDYLLEYIPDAAARDAARRKVAELRAATSVQAEPFGYVTAGAVEAISGMPTDFPTLKNVMIRNRPVAACTVPLYLAAPTTSTADAKDAGRLDFMAQHEAWIAWSKDGESCRVFIVDEDGGTRPFMGWRVPDAWQSTPRDAIDAAIATSADEVKS